MDIRPDALKGLAAVLVTKGAPILADIVGGAIGGPFGAIAASIVGSVIPQIATAFGLPADATCEQVTATVSAAPDADAKLATIEAQHKAALDWAQLQVDMNHNDAQLGTSLLGKAFFSGWRPFFAWVMIFWLTIIFYHTWQGGSLTPQFLAVWNPVWPVFGGMMALRTVEKFGGVAQAATKISGPLKQWLTRK